MKEAPRGPELGRTFCPRCDRNITVAITPAPLHDGHANIPDAGDIVCLDFGAQCDGPMCATFGQPRIVMGLRLARSGMRPDALPTVQAVCDGCARFVRMDVIDGTHAHCTECDTVNIWTLIRVDGEEWVAVTGKRAEAEM